MQVRSAKTAYLHLSRSSLNFAAFLAQIFLLLNLLLYTPFFLSFLRCAFSPGLSGSFKRNFDQTFWFSNASCSRVMTRLIFKLLIFPSTRLRHFVLLYSLMNKRSVAYSCASVEVAVVKINNKITDSLVIVKKEVRICLLKKIFVNTMSDHKNNFLFYFLKFFCITADIQSRLRVAYCALLSLSKFNTLSLSSSKSPELSL